MCMHTHAHALCAHVQLETRVQQFTRHHMLKPGKPACTGYETRKADQYCWTDGRIRSGEQTAGSNSSGASRRMITRLS